MRQKRLQRSRLKQLSMRRYWLLHGRIYRHQDITAFYQMKKLKNSDRSVCRNLIEGAALVVATFVKGCVGFDRLSGEPVNECGNGWGYYDLGLQNENFVLKAKELGLDTLIMGIRDGEAIRNFLDVPENEQIVSVIAVGYGAKDVQMPKRKSVSEIAKFY